MNGSKTSSLSPTLVLHGAITTGGDGRRSAWFSRRAFASAMVASLAVHLALSLWPVELPSTPDTQPLQATITELPPPPKPTAAPAKPKPKPKRVIPPPAPVTEPEPATATAEASSSEPEPRAAEPPVDSTPPASVAAAPELP